MRLQINKIKSFIKKIKIKNDDSVYFTQNKNNNILYLNDFQLDNYYFKENIENNNNSIKKKLIIIILIIHILVFIFIFFFFWLHDLTTEVGDPIFIHFIFCIDN